MLPEHIARYIFSQVVETVEALLDCGLCHLDIKVGFLSSQKFIQILTQTRYTGPKHSYRREVEGEPFRCS